VRRDPGTRGKPDEDAPVESARTPEVDVLQSRCRQVQSGQLKEAGETPVLARGVTHLFGIELGAAQVVAIAAALGALSFYSPGISSGGLFIMTPIYLTFGLPIEAIGLLIAVDIVVDTFITTANVTANVTVAALLARGAVAAVAAEPASAPAVEARV
jgi:hypothetical protein